MKLGTHNSMSYLPPKKWYMKMFTWTAKCQSVDVERLYKMGARMFDIRVAFDKNGNPEFRHGHMAFRGNVDLVFKILNRKRRKIYIRLVLEVTNEKLLLRLRNRFISFCKELESKYEYLIFFCGRSKYRWKEIYKFKHNEPEIIQKVSSMTGTMLDDLYPYLYAKLYNKSNIRKHNFNKWLLIDFIDILYK